MVDFLVKHKRLTKIGDKVKLATKIGYDYYFQPTRISIIK
jgi:hypothetical protein